jgi:hypothetical protein
MAAKKMDNEREATEMDARDGSGEVEGVPRRAPQLNFLK